MTARRILALSLYLFVAVTIIPTSRDNKGMQAAGMSKDSAGLANKPSSSHTETTRGRKPQT